MRIRRLAAVAVAGTFALASLTACIGTDGDGPRSQDDCAPAEEAMAAAKDRLDETSGIDVHLHTGDSSGGVHVIEASVSVMRPDSFEGTFTGGLGGSQLNGQIVGIGDTIWAELPVLWPRWSEVDTDQYPIPNLAVLIAEDGLSNALVMTDDLSEPRAERDEADTSRVFCYYDGTLSAETVARILPTAAGDDFAVEYAVDGAGELRKATLTGDPYGRDESMTYVIDITAYDLDIEIEPPV